MLNSKLAFAATLIAVLMAVFVGCSADEIKDKVKETETKARETAASKFEDTIKEMNFDKVISDAKAKGGDELSKLTGDAETKMADIKDMLKKLTSGEGVMSELTKKLGEAVPNLGEILKQITSAMNK